MIPQVVAGLILGFFTQNVFGGESVYTLVLGGCSMILSGLLTLLVNDSEDIRLPIEAAQPYESPATPNPAV